MILWLALVWVTGCGGDDGATQAPDTSTDAAAAEAGDDAATDDGAADASPAEDSAAATDAGLDDAGLDGGQPPFDAGPPGPACPEEAGFDGLRLVFTPEAAVCAGFRRTWQESVATRGQIHLRPQIIEVVEDPDVPVEVDLIDRIVIGSSRVVLSPTTAGTLRYELLEWGDPSSHCHQLTFDQAFDMAGTPYALSASMRMCVNDGVPRERQICFHDDGKVAGAGGFQGRWTDARGEVWFHTFTPCHYRDIPLWRMDLTLDSGAELRLYKRFNPPAGGSGPARLVRGEVDFDGVERVVTDHFRLAYGAEHHNWNQHYVVRFEPPIGDAHGVVVGSHSWGSGDDPGPGQAWILGEALDVTEELTVTSFSQERL